MAPSSRVARAVAPLLVLTFLLELFAPIAPAFAAPAMRVTEPVTPHAIISSAIESREPSVATATSMAVAGASHQVAYPGPATSPTAIPVANPYPAPETSLPRRNKPSPTSLSLNVQSASSTSSTQTTANYRDMVLNGGSYSTDNGKKLTQITRYMISGGPCAVFNPCAFDTLAYLPRSDGSFLESITIGNYFWNYVGETLVSSGTLSGARYGQPGGPCAVISPCAFQSRTIFILSGGSVLESVTAGGRFWNYDGAGNLLAASDRDLRNIYRYSYPGGTAGLCANRPANGCVFDTRTVYTDNSGNRIEEITAYGTLWRYNAESGAFLNSLPIPTSSHYAQGICVGVPAANCVYGLREAVRLEAV